MMDADIEHLVLSGKLFGTNSRSSSPERTPSPALSFASDVFDDEKLAQDAPDVDATYESIGMGPGRTGVKGVIRDQHEARAIQAAKRERELEALRRRMERGNLGGKTFLEEEAERRAAEERAGEHEREDEDELMRRVRRDVLGRPKGGPFGHLREVGRAGFVGAVESEERGVWVVIHIYESSLERCYSLDDTLSKLARLYPHTKFLRARAASLGFASKGSSKKRYATYSQQQSMPGRFVEGDEDDPYSDGEEEKEPFHDEEEYEEEDVDTDMLPTLLAYRDGELVHNWVRVDWEAGKAGIEELLLRRHIITETTSSGNGNCGLPSDEEDLIWSDEEATS